MKAHVTGAGCAKNLEEWGHPEHQDAGYHLRDQLQQTSSDMLLILKMTIIAVAIKTSVTTTTTNSLSQAHTNLDDHNINAHAVSPPMLCSWLVVSAPLGRKCQS